MYTCSAAVCDVMCTGSSQAVSKETPLRLELLCFAGDLCSSPRPQCRSAGCSRTSGPLRPGEGRTSFLFPQRGVLFGSISVLQTLLVSAPGAPSTVWIDDSL